MSRHLPLAAAALLAACSTEAPLPTAPAFKAGGAPAQPLTVTPTALSFTLPGGAAQTLTAKVQYVTTISATSSDATGCASVSPSSVPATKPVGSSQYVATFTVTPVALGACTITVTDKKGQVVVVPVSVEGSVNSGRILYTSTRDGNLEIYVMGSNGSTRLTNTSGREFDPIFSPDGTKILFASDRDGVTTCLYVMNADGTNVVKLTSGVGDIEPSYSPDGSKILFSSYRIDYGTSGLTSYTTDLWIMNADGSNQTLLYNGEVGASHARFSPDGTKIVFNYGWHIMVMDPDGSNLAQLTTVEDNITPSWSPDGTKIVFASDVGSTFFEVWVMNADGSSPTRLTTSNAGAGTPTFSPDGTRIVFGRSSGGTNDDIYVINADGSNLVRLTANAAQDIKPTWGN